MPSDHSEITAYVNEGDIDRIAATLTAIAAREGRQPVARPQRASIRYILEPSDAWNFALLPGAPGWTVVHAQPWNVLCYPAASTGSRRFVELCEALGVRGFVIDTVDQDYHGNMLVETDGHGSCRLSGWYFPPHGDPAYCGMPLDEDTLEGVTFEVCADLECAHSLVGTPGSLDMQTCREIAHGVGGENGRQFWSSGEDFSGAWHEIQEAMSTGGPSPDAGGAVLQFETGPRRLPAQTQA